MKRTTIAATIAIPLCALWFDVATAQEAARVTEPERVVTIKPNYLPPSELLDFLGVESSGGRSGMIWRTSQGRQEVLVRHNETANLIVLAGPAGAVAHVEELIRQVDTPPRQIEIEVRIIEISSSKARDVGLDWDRALNTGHPRIYGSYRKGKDKSYQTTVTQDVARHSDRFTSVTDRDAIISGYAYLDELINILDSTGVGTVRTAPRILTLNNRRATIVDGQRVTYVAEYSSYTNLYEIDSMDAGLTLSVLPSLGESGYITLQINAELTTLNDPLDNHGSPVKDGQMIDNTVIVKNGQSVLLGGLTRTVEQKSQKRFPILGHVLPFLFSRQVTINHEVQSYIVLTPRVVDFGGNLDEDTRRLIEGG
ncbi:MAG: hypothetical protein KAW46_08050 [candidate division Zixibacteria bacterium]|nr:hypothetical protein [candidate division Zixibacteria bacterium]